MKGTVVAVCISESKGTQKRDVGKITLKRDWGIEGDGHAGPGHRQVSLLSYDRVKAFNAEGAGVTHGDFGENIIVEGLDLGALPVGTLLTCGQAVLEVTQIGKDCHDRCHIYFKMGDCIMPREGIFSRVLQEGEISNGDIIEAVLPENKAITAAVITLSDKAAAGERVDESGAIIVEMLRNFGYVVEEALILPDEFEQIKEKLITFSDLRQVNLIVTTGGTGFAPRDITPEATLAVSERAAPGIAEAIRCHSMQITGRAMFSRAASVIRGNTLIINLPGGPKAVRESLEFILPHLEHGLEILLQKSKECAR